MIIQGKHNNAEIFTSNIDSTTISQIINLCNQEIFKDSIIKIMPDCHAGKGCTIGTTMTITDKIVPNLVGVDIGCGVASVCISKDFKLEEIDKVIKEFIPHGFNCHKDSREKILKEIFNIDLRKLKCSENINIQRAFLSLGTLGGGNHFIEINEGENGNRFLTVHSGSRNLGKNVADYYQSKAIEYCEKKYKNLKNEIILKLKNENKENEIELEISKIKKPEDALCYLEGELMENYLYDMNIVQKFAKANRICILAEILYYYDYKNNTSSLKEYYIVVKNILTECTHNYIDIEKRILRKGAISAEKDKAVIIPINMKDGIIFGFGKGNSNWNYSAPHGAGRILSRGKAKEKISLEEFKKSMKDVYTTSVGLSTLDEAPQAYKPIEEIIENIKDTVEIIEVFKPVYNFKSN